MRIQSSTMLHRHENYLIWEQFGLSINTWNVLSLPVEYKDINFISTIKNSTIDLQIYVVNMIDSDHKTWNPTGKQCISKENFSLQFDCISFQLFNSMTKTRYFFLKRIFSFKVVYKYSIVKKNCLQPGNKLNDLRKIFNKEFMIPSALKVSWADASMICKKQGGHLPVFTNKNEMHKLIAWLKFSVVHTFTEAVYIGLLQNGVSFSITFSINETVLFQGNKVC